MTAAYQPLSHSCSLKWERVSGKPFKSHAITQTTKQHVPTYRTLVSFNLYTHIKMMCAAMLSFSALCNRSNIFFPCRNIKAPINQQLSHEHGSMYHISTSAFMSTSSRSSSSIEKRKYIYIYLCFV